MFVWGGRSNIVLFCILVLLALLNAIDYFATQDLVVNGPHLEWNPPYARLVSTPCFFLYKLVLIPLGLIFLWKVRRVVVPKYLGLLIFACGLYGFITLRAWLVFYF